MNIWNRGSTHIVLTDFFWNSCSNVGMLLRAITIVVFRIWRIFVSYWCHQHSRESKPWISEFELSIYCSERFFLQFVRAITVVLRIGTFSLVVGVFYFSRNLIPVFLNTSFTTQYWTNFILEFVWARVECFCEQSQLWSNKLQCPDDNLCKWWSRGHNSSSVLVWLKSIPMYCRYLGSIRYQ